MSVDTEHTFIAPDGGWGIVIAISVAVTFMVTADQLTAFGIVYGNYLRRITDEGSASAMINGIFHTVANIAGLLANHIIQNHSFRTAGIIGSLIFFTGNVLSIFADKVWQLCLTFGVLQGMGLGIMITAMFASFNEYYVKKKNFMMGVSQTLVAACSMVVPYIAQVLMDTYGYRGTVAILAAISLHSFLAMLTLQPVKWHMIKVPFSPNEMSYLSIETDNVIEQPNIAIVQKRIPSVLNVISKFLLLSLLKEPKYVNISVGAAACWISDILFISLLPMFIRHMGYSDADTAYLMTIYMICDIVGRLLFSVLNLLIIIKTRTIFLLGITTIIIFRLAFTFCSGPWTNTIVILSILGLIRCFITVPIPLVLAEYAGIRFPAAYSLYQAISAVISTIFGQLSSLVSLYTTDAWMQHLLTFQLLLCVLPWTIEKIY